MRVTFQIRRCVFVAASAALLACCDSEERNICLEPRGAPPIEVARACSKIDSWLQAVDAYRLALKEAPNDVDIWREYSAVLSKLGREDEAAEALQKSTGVERTK
jgi:tetratricopeptide (TPR) repeat protein